MERGAELDRAAAGLDPCAYSSPARGLAAAPFAPPNRPRKRGRGEPKPAGCEILTSSIYLARLFVISLGYRQQSASYQ